MSPIRARSITRQTLLLCGLFSSLLYVATDVAGGLRYPGYDFSSQAISELMAIGAPSERFVDPLFLTSGILFLAFMVGVVREAAGRNRALLASAILLAAYGVIGLTGPTLFEMHPRGSASGVVSDVPHIIVTAVLVLLLLLAMTFGALALGMRFRIYSLATIVVVITFGALAGTFASRLAANQPTPGFGIIERISIYASMAWIAVLGVALLRRPLRGGKLIPGGNRSPTQIAGTVAPGFEEVREEFRRNFDERGEIGAAVAAYWNGEKVVDLWGGRRTPDSDEPWLEDTMVVVMSTTKGLAAMTAAVANARGWLDYDLPVACYWPEFGQNGKSSITVRQLLGHEAGLVLLDRKLTVDMLRDLDVVAGVLARQKPAWAPGTRHGYHAMTIGLYLQEIIRRTDPTHRSLGRFFHEEIASPLGLDFYIGLPREIPEARLAKVKPMSPGGAIRALRNTPSTLITKVLWPWSLVRKSLNVASGMDFNTRAALSIEVPAGNGVGTARSIARAYSALSLGGAELGLTSATMERITAEPAFPRPKDEVIGVDAYYSLGWLRPGPQVAFGSSTRAFGHPGAGGSFGFADPDARLGYGYVMNKLDYWLVDDPREKALRDAVYRCIRQLEVASATFDCASRNSSWKTPATVAV